MPKGSILYLSSFKRNGPRNKSLRASSEMVIGSQQRTLQILPFSTLLNPQTIALLWCLVEIFWLDTTHGYFLLMWVGGRRHCGRRGQHGQGRRREVAYIRMYHSDWNFLQLGCCDDWGQHQRFLCSVRHRQVHVYWWSRSSTLWSARTTWWRRPLRLVTSWCNTSVRMFIND